MNYMGKVTGVLTRGAKTLYFARPCKYDRLNSSLSIARGALSNLVERPGTKNMLILKLNYRGGGVTRLRGTLNGLGSRQVQFLGYRSCRSRVTRNVDVVGRLRTVTSGSEHRAIPISGLGVKLGYNNDSNLSKVATGPVYNEVASGAITVNNATVLARIPRVFNTRRLLVGHYVGRAIFGGAMGLVGGCGGCFVTRRRPIDRGPSPKGGTNNVAALRRGSLNYIRGNNGTPVATILSCKSATREPKLGLLSNPNGSVITMAGLATTNYRLVLFAANENAPLKTPIPAIGVTAGASLTRHGGD